MDGEPNRFVTLTVNPHWFESPAERGARLSRAWRDYVKHWRRLRPSQTLQYLVVVELTKRGEPHLHIMIRGGRVPQAELSKFMNDAIGAPIVDIRMVRDKTQVAQYVSKYISKRPIRLGSLKRYWRSLGYFSDEVKARRKTRQPKRAIWILDVTLQELKQTLSINQRVQWQKHPAMTAWTMYEWETAPPILSNLVRRLR